MCSSPRPRCELSTRLISALTPPSSQFVADAPRPSPPARGHRNANSTPRRLSPTNRKYARRSRRCSYHHDLPRFALGSSGGVLGHGAFGDEPTVLGMPCVERRHPRGDAARAPVRDQRVRPGHPAEQSQVRGRVLPVAPLPSQRPAILARGDRQQAPSIRHVRAVRLGVMAHAPSGTIAGLTFQHHATRRANTCRETPINASDSRIALVPVTRLRNAAELRHARPAPPLPHAAEPAVRAQPPLPARAREPLLAHRSPHNEQRIAPDDLLLLMEQANPAMSSSRGGQPTRRTTSHDTQDTSRPRPKT